MPTGSLRCNGHRELHRSAMIVFSSCGRAAMDRPIFSVHGAWELRSRFVDLATSEVCVAVR
jgi:hypothetical protein